KQLRETVTRHAPQAPVVETQHGPVELVNSAQQRAALEDLRQRPVAAFCGIGNPEAFRRTLTDQGASLCDFRTYADHHPYSRADVEELRRWAGQLPATQLLHVGPGVGMM